MKQHPQHHLGLRMFQDHQRRNHYRTHRRTSRSLYLSGILIVISLIAYVSSK